MIETITDWLLGDGLKITIIIAVAVVAYILFKIWGTRIIHTLAKVKITKSDRTDKGSELRLKTLTKVFIRTGVIVILAIVILMILQGIGINITPVLAGAGVMGLAIGFGAQSLIKDFLNGFFILLEDQFVDGDVVEIEGKKGTVEDFSLRRTILRDYRGNVHVIPNSQVKMVTNFTHGWSNALIKITVTYKENADRVIELLQKIGAEFTQDEEFKEVLIGPVKVLGINDFTNAGVNISLTVKTLPSRQWKVKRELLRRIKNVFDQEGVELSHWRKMPTLD